MDASPGLDLSGRTVGFEVNSFRPPSRCIIPALSGIFVRGVFFLL